MLHTLLLKGETVGPVQKFGKFAPMPCQNLGEDPSLKKCHASTHLTPTHPENTHFEVTKFKKLPDIPLFRVREISYSQKFPIDAA